MRNANRSIFVAIATVALAACNQRQPAEQNIVMDNAVDANAQIETLPPDESSAIPSNQLVNGDDNPDVSELDTASNSY